jgi:hypothetical protein
MNCRFATHAPLTAMRPRAFSSAMRSLGASLRSALRACTSAVATCDKLACAAPPHRKWVRELLVLLRNVDHERLVRNLLLAHLDDLRLEVLDRLQVLACDLVVKGLDLVELRLVVLQSRTARHDALASGR